jgi:hypothetical protein
MQEEDEMLTDEANNVEERMSVDPLEILHSKFYILHSVNG